MQYLNASVRPSGLEPETYCLEGSCSIRLSYGRKCDCCEDRKVYQGT